MAEPAGAATHRGATPEPAGPPVHRAATLEPPGPAGATAPVERLEGWLRGLRAEGRAALVAYGVAGYPDLAGSLDAFRAMADAGADVLEVGPPYSDPLIDGPVIQRAVTAALDAGTRMDDVLGLVADLTAGVDIPVVLLVYYNLVAHRGAERFAAELAAAGACGAVVPDLPPEEAGEWLAAAGRQRVAPVFLAAPTSAGRPRPRPHRPARLRRHRRLQRRAGRRRGPLRRRCHRRHRPGPPPGRGRPRRPPRPHRRARRRRPRLAGALAGSA